MSLRTLRGHHDMRFRSDCTLDKLVVVCCRSDNADVGFQLEKGADAFPNNQVVVREKHRDSPTHQLGNRRTVQVRLEPLRITNALAQSLNRKMPSQTTHWLPFVPGGSRIKRPAHGVSRPDVDA